MIVMEDLFQTVQVFYFFWRISKIIYIFAVPLENRTVWWDG